MYNPIELRSIVDKGLHNLKFSNNPISLYEPIKYVLTLEAKRVRPILMLLSHQIFNPNIEKALQTALGIELFHNFTLLHDDIMDKAPIRRGMVTVHEKYNENAAILSGDALFTAAYQAIELASPEVMPQLLRLVNKTSMEVCEGQQLDLDFEEQENVTEQMYLEMIRLKTSVLLASSCAMGAICAGASNERVELWYEFGENLGLAFQIQDDYLDTFGQQSSTGKKVGGDIIAGKKTFLLIHAMSVGEIPSTEACSDDEKIAIIKSAMRSLGSDIAAKELMKGYSEAASKALDGLNLQLSTKSWFEELLFSVTERMS